MGMPVPPPRGVCAPPAGIVKKQNCNASGQSGIPACRVSAGLAAILAVAAVDALAAFVPRRDLHRLAPVRPAAALAQPAPVGADEAAAADEAARHLQHMHQPQ